MRVAGCDNNRTLNSATLQPLLEVCPTRRILRFSNATPFMYSFKVSRTLLEFYRPCLYLLSSCILEIQPLI